MKEHQTYFLGLNGFIILIIVLAIFSAMAKEVPVTTMQRVIGIVEVPSLFGVPDPQGPPGSRLQTTLTPISLYQQPNHDSSTIAIVKDRDQFDTSEYTYEEHGALVYQQQKGWYLIGLHDVTENTKAWLKPADAGHFHSLSDLLTTGPAYFTTVWDNKLWAEPGTGQITMIDRTAKDINVLNTRKIGDQTWLQVEVLKPGRCESPTPKIITRGWVPVYSQEGNMNVWFYARGC